MAKRSVRQCRILPRLYCCLMVVLALALCGLLQEAEVSDPQLVFPLGNSSFIGIPFKKGSDRQTQIVNNSNKPHTVRIEAAAKRDAEEKAAADLAAAKKAEEKTAAEAAARKKAEEQAAAEAAAKKETEESAAAEVAPKKEAEENAAADLAPKKEAEEKAAVDVAAKIEAEEEWESQSSPNGPATFGETSAAEVPLNPTDGTKASSDGNMATEGSDALLVALAAGLRQVEDVLVVVNSAISHAKRRDRLHFRIITQASEASELSRKLHSRLPRDVKLQTVDFDRLVPRVSQLLGGKSSTRAELFDVGNFAAFYLHELFPAAGRVLYLDVDVVVLADLAEELLHRDMKEHPLAVARDCSQKVSKYIDIDRLKKILKPNAVLQRLKLDKKICVINRGVVLVNIESWAKSNLTETIEQLVAAHLTPGVGPLWRSGVSQPPFLLAVGKNFLDLGPEYNVRGLGRGDIAPEEIAYYRKKGLWTSYFDQFTRKCEFNCCPGCKGWSMTPYVATIADRAKILHFNGRLKPSKAGRRPSSPLSKPSPHMTSQERAEREQRPLCSCGPECLRECAGLWWEYLPPPA